MAKAKWQIEAEKRVAAEKELARLKERIPMVLAECVTEYNLTETLCSDGLQDFCERLGAAEYKPVLKGTVVITVDNIDLPGEASGHYGINIHDDTLEYDLENLVTKFLGDRYPNAQWDTTTVSFER